MKYHTTSSKENHPPQDCQKLVTGGDDYGAICGCEHAASEQLTHSVWHHLAEHLFLREHGLSVSSLKKKRSGSRQ